MIDSVNLLRRESKSELAESLRESRSILLGTEVDAPREFYLLEVRSESAMQTVGILSAGVGVKPAWVIRNDRLYVGFNSRVAVLEGSDVLETTAEISLLTLFRQFLDAPSVAHVIVLGETAVIAIAMSGAEAWRADTDLIKDFKRSDTTLYLEFLDDDPASLDLATGGRV